MRVNNMGGGDQGVGVGDVAIDDLEGLHREIHEYNETGSSNPEDISPSLERYLSYVAKSGNIVFPWQHVKNLFRNKIQHAMEQFTGEMCPNNETFVMERFDLFRAAPFTIQRLTELVTQPTRHYKKKEKFLRGLEKTVLVVTTVEPWSIDNDVKNGNDSSDEGDMDLELEYSESDEISTNRVYSHSGLLSSEEMQSPAEMIGQVHHSAVASEIPGLVVTATGDVLESISQNSIEHDILGKSEGISDETLPSTVLQDSFERHTDGEGTLDTVTTTMVTIMSEGDDDDDNDILTQSTSTTTEHSVENSSYAVVEGKPVEQIVLKEDTKKYLQDPELSIDQAHHADVEISRDSVTEEPVVTPGDIMESIPQTSTEHEILVTQEASEAMTVTDADTPAPLHQESSFVSHNEGIIENVTTTMVTIMSEGDHSLSQTTATTENSSAEAGNISTIVEVEEKAADQIVLITEEEKEKHRDLLDDTTALPVSSALDSSVENLISAESSSEPKVLTMKSETVDQDQVDP